MLILSRRESEKVLFPKLGITIEVTRVQGRTVRLGIDAPDEIRIIRGELEHTADRNVKPKSGKGSYASGSYDSNSKKDWDAPQDIRQCLDAANLAIHLAQNQLRQQLSDSAEVALEHAIECMENLERAVGLAPNPLDSTPVREAKSGYSFARQKNALCVNFDADSATAIGGRLKQLGYLPTLLDSGKSLIEFLTRREQPDLIMTMQERFAVRPLADQNDNQKGNNQLDYCDHGNDRFDDANGFDSGLRMFGVGSLQRCKRTIEFADSEVTSWFADASDAAIVDQCFQV